MISNRTSLLAIAGLVMVACGGGGSGANSFVAGSYNGAVSDTSVSSVIIEMTIASDGTITGKCSLTKVGSAAVIGRGNLTGFANSSTRTFAVSGTYYLTVPPAPGWPSSGPVTVSGTIPLPSIANNPVQVTRDLNSATGVLNPVVP